MSIRMVIIKKARDKNADQNVENIGPLHTGWWEYLLVLATMGNSMGVPLPIKNRTAI